MRKKNRKIFENWKEAMVWYDCSSRINMWKDCKKKPRYYSTRKKWRMEDFKKLHKFLTFGQLFLLTSQTRGRNTTRCQRFSTSTADATTASMPYYHMLPSWPSISSITNTTIPITTSNTTTTNTLNTATITTIIITITTNTNNTRYHHRGC